MAIHAALALTCLALPAHRANQRTGGALVVVEAGMGGSEKEGRRTVTFSSESGRVHDACVAGPATVRRGKLRQFAR